MRRLLRPALSEALAGAALPLQLTAIVLLLTPDSIWYIRPLLLALAASGLLFPIALRTPALWAGTAALVAVSVFREWPMPDNHDYLMIYWTIAICLALCTARPNRTLAVSARWLIVAVFALATIWKGVLSPDYRDDRFYRITLLTDSRFAETTALLGDLTPRQLAENRAYLGRPYAGDVDVEPRLNEPPAVSRLATLLTWATILLEGSVAAAFLFAWGRWTILVRHGLLLLFCFTTYFIAPITGFGWLLAIMGLAQVPQQQRALRAAYVGTCLLIQLYSDVPWGRLLFEMGFGRLT
jgi:hypothetical protein